MTWHESVALASVPIVAQTLVTVLHLVLTRLRPAWLPWQSLAVASAAGVVFAVGMTVAIVDHGSSLDLACYVILNSGASVAFAFGYFNFVNLNYTSLRVRLLRELAHRSGGFTVDDIMRQYNAGVALDLRLARLVKAGELRFDGTRYYLGSSRKFLSIGRTVRVVRGVLGVRPQEPKSVKCGEVERS